MAAPSSNVSVAHDITNPVEVQYNFSNQYNLDDPEEARMSYQRIMHEHTMQQYETATQSSRRRNSPHDHHMSGLQQESSIDSVDSSDLN